MFNLNILSMILTQNVYAMFVKPVVDISVALAVYAFYLQLNVVVLVIIEATDTDFECWKHSPEK